MPLTYRLQLKALDYIVKNNDSSALEKSFLRCIKNVCVPEETEIDTFIIKTSNRIIKYKLSDIMFICTNGKKGIVEIHTNKGFEEARDTIKSILNKTPSLVQVHQGVIVNHRNITEIDRKKRIITMINGETCELAYRYRRTISELFNEDKATDC